MAFFCDNPCEKIITNYNIIFYFMSVIEQNAAT